MGRKRRSGTGCVSEINDHLFEGRYSPKWPDGKKHARNVYAHTREECEEKLKTLIVEMKAEIAEAQRLMDLGKGDGQPLEEKGKRRERKRMKKIVAWCIIFCLCFGIVEVPNVKAISDINQNIVFNGEGF